MYSNLPSKGFSEGSDDQNTLSPIQNPLNRASKLSSANSDEKDLSMSTSLQSFNLKKDPNYQRFVSSIQKNLLTFEYVTEWADITSFLTKLLRVLESYSDFNIIPEKETVAKRLSQCLNPALPTGVHQKALSVYSKIFDQIGIYNLASDINIYVSGLYPFIRHASTVSKDQAIEILKTNIYPVILTNPVHLPMFLVAVISGIEEEKSEISSKCQSLLKLLANNIESRVIYSSLFQVLISSSLDRENTLKFLLQSLPELTSPLDVDKKIGTSLDTMVKAICVSLSSTNTLVVRSAMDLLHHKLPLDKSLLTLTSKIELMKFTSRVILLKDMSLNRRIFTWWLGKSSDSEIQLKYFLQYSLSPMSEMFKGWFQYTLLEASEFKEFLTPFKILNSLSDKSAIFKPLTDSLLFTVTRSYLMKIQNIKKAGYDIDDQTDQEAIKFFSSIESFQLFSLVLTACFSVPFISDETYSKNVRGNFSIYKSEIDILFLFFQHYILKDSSVEPTHFCFVLLTLNLLPCLLLQKFEGDLVEPTIISIFKLSNLILKHIPQNSLSVKLPVELKFKTFEDKLSLLEYVKAIYGIDFYIDRIKTEKSGLEITASTIECKGTADQIQKLEKASNYPESILFLFNKETQALVKNYENNPEAFKYLSDTFQILLLNHYSYYKNTSNSLTSGSNFKTLQTNGVDSKEKEYNTFQIFANVASFSNNMEQVKLAVNTLFIMISNGYESNKHSLYQIHNYNRYALMNSSAVHNSNYLTLIISNIWKLINFENYVEATMLIHTFSMVYGENKVSSIISQSICNFKDDLSGFLTRFSLFWKFKNTFELSSNLPAEQYQSFDSIVPNDLNRDLDNRTCVSYTRLLICVLSFVFNLSAHDSSDLNGQKLFISASDSKKDYMFLSSAFLSKWAKSGISFEHVVFPLLENLHSLSSEYLYLEASNNISYTSVSGTQNENLYPSTKVSIETIQRYLYILKKSLIVFQEQASDLLLRTEDISWVKFHGLNSLHHRFIKDQNHSTRYTRFSKSLENDQLYKVDPAKLFELSLSETDKYLCHRLESFGNSEEITVFEYILYELLPSLGSGLPTELIELDSKQLFDNPSIDIKFETIFCSRLNLQISAIEILDLLININPECNFLQISPECISMVLNILSRIYYFVSNVILLKQSDLESDYSTEVAIRQKCQSVLSRIISSFFADCKCSICVANQGTNTHQKLVYEVIPFFLQSEFFYSALLLSFPCLPLSKPFSQQALYSEHMHWHDLFSNVLKLFENTQLEKGISLPNSSSLTTCFLSNIALPIINLATETIFIDFQVYLHRDYVSLINSRNGLREDDFNFFFANLLTLESVLNLCLSVSKHILPLTPRVSELLFCNLSAGIQNILKAQRNLEFDLNVLRIVHLHLDKLEQPFSFSLTYCLSTLMCILNETHFENHKTTGFDNDRVNLNLSEKQSLASEPKNTFMIEKIRSVIKIVIFNLFDSHSKEVCLALGDYFEHQTSCWIDLLFNPISSIRTSVEYTLFAASNNPKSRNSSDFHPGANEYSVRRGSEPRGPVRVSGNFSGLSHGNLGSYTNSAYLQNYLNAVNSYPTMKQILESFSFLEIFKRTNKSQHSIYEADSDYFSSHSFYDKSNLSFMGFEVFDFVSCLVSCATDRVRQNLSGGYLTQNKAFSNQDTDIDLNSGYSRFSSLSDIGLLRLAEIILETECLRVINCSDLSIFYSSADFDLETVDYHGIQISQSKLTNILSNFNLSILSLFRLVNSFENINKPWIPIVFRTCVSALKVLSLIKSNKLPFRFALNTSLSEKAESESLSFIENILEYLGKSISGTQWLRRVGRLPSSNARLDLESSSSGRPLLDNSAADKKLKFMQKFNLNNFSKYVRSFETVEAMTESGLVASDSALLSVFRNSHLTDTLSYWNHDDVTEQLLLSLNENLFRFINFMYSDKTSRAHIVNLYINSVIYPLNRVLSIKNHYSFASSKFDGKKFFFSDQGVSINEELSTSQFNELGRSAAIPFNLPTSDNFDSIRKAYFDQHKALIDLGLVYPRSSCLFEDSSWCITDQASRIYNLLLSSLMPISSYSEFTSNVSKLFWEFFFHNNFFSAKRVGFSSFPIFSINSSQAVSVPFTAQSHVSSILTSSIYKWRFLLGVSVSNDRSRLLELIGKLGTSAATSLFSNKSQEMLQKSLTIRRVSVLIWASKNDEITAQFPTIQEKIVELIKSSADNNVIIEIYLLLRVIIHKLGPSRIASMWPVIITELSKVVSTCLALDSASTFKISFGTLNVFFACCKFLDLLFAYDLPDFLIYKHMFIGGASNNLELQCSTNYRFISESFQRLMYETFSFNEPTASSDINKINQENWYSKAFEFEHSSQMPDLTSLNQNTSPQTGLLLKLGNKLLEFLSKKEPDTRSEDIGMDSLKEPSASSSTGTTLDSNSQREVNGTGAGAGAGDPEGENDSSSLGVANAGVSLDLDKINRKSSTFLRHFSTKIMSKPSLRRPILSESYIYSIFQLLPFLHNVSRYDYEMTLAGSKPDTLYIESLIGQDLMVFYDTNTVTPTPISQGTSLENIISSVDLALREGFVNEYTPECSILKTLEEKEGFF
ncbi:hypothetical protein BB560_006764 [Smittium megazygosporum]|uniref:Uncharacterized protein n=1 Tax=Smittium megazygosporum TaxID=133381 RepID=A0A2T9Y1U7_9FUNG|nr:hypothetical protein BB560_006764 [Smittium megazygosporum]